MTTREWMVSCLVVGLMLASRNNVLVNFAIVFGLITWMRVFK